MGVISLPEILHQKLEDDAARAFVDIVNETAKAPENGKPVRSGNLGDSQRHKDPGGDVGGCGERIR